MGQHYYSKGFAHVLRGLGSHGCIRFVCHPTVAQLLCSPSAKLGNPGWFLLEGGL